MRGSPSGTRRPVIGLVAAGVAGEEEDGGAREQQGSAMEGASRRELLSLALCVCVCA